jgi:hypothetical protein
MRPNDFARLAAIGAVLRQFSVASSAGLDAFVSRQLARGGIAVVSFKVPAKRASRRRSPCRQQLEQSQIDTDVEFT